MSLSSLSLYHSFSRRSRYSRRRSLNLAQGSTVNRMWPWLVVLGAIGLLRPVGIPAQTIAESGWHNVAVHQSPLRVGLSFETIRLPEGEPLGLLGKSLLFEVRPRMYVGPLVLSGVTGRRGGFFVLGAEGRISRPVGPIAIDAGLAVGGGGGVAAPVGDGLVLRPSVAAWVPVAGWRLGVQATYAHFPSGDISSGQFGVALEGDELFRYASAAHVGQRVSAMGRAGLGIDDISVTSSRTTLRGVGSTPRTIAIVGARATRALGQFHALEFAGGLETGGAAYGDAAGYMEVLSVIHVHVPVVSHVELGGSAALGAGGGGAVPMGSGGLVRGSLTASLILPRQLRLRAEVGAQKALGSALRGMSRGVAISMPLAPASRDTVHLGRVEWSPVLLHFGRGARTGGTTQSLQTMGLSIGRYASSGRYLTVQGHSAFGGAAGAYAIGLFGVGIATEGDRRWRTGVEGLIGAAGGGGVATGGGAVAELHAWASVRTGKDVELRMLAGATRSRSGSLASPVLGLGAVRAFAMPSTK